MPVDERGGVKGIAFLQDATPLSVKLVAALVPGQQVCKDSAPLRRELKPINPKPDSLLVFSLGACSTDAIMMCLSVWVKIPPSLFLGI